MYFDSYTNDNKITKLIISKFALGLDILINSKCLLCNLPNSVPHVLICQKFDLHNCVLEFVQNLKIEAESVWNSEKYKDLISEIGSALYVDSLFLFLGVLDFNIPGLTQNSVFGIYKSKKLYRFICKSLINLFQSILVKTMRKDTYIQILKHVIS